MSQFLELGDIVAKLRERSKTDMTERELATLRYMSRGLVSKQIAAELGVSPRSIEVYRTRIMRTLGAKTPAHAIYIACQRGIL